jgi:hypothetical protein
MKPHDKPDLDLIAMVQRARRQHDDQAIPSQAAGVYWIEAVPETAGRAPTSRAGRWIIPTNVHEVDKLWAKIRNATKAGTLGYKAKVSTAARELGMDKDDRIIHVTTYDAEDAADVERVRQALRELGISGRIEYEHIGER